MKHIIFITLIFNLLCSNLFATSFILPVDGRSVRTEDVIREKLDYSSVSVAYDLKSLKKCKLIKKVKNQKSIDFWNEKKACEIRIKELKKDTALLKANFLYLEMSKFSCTSISEGDAYSCPE